MTASHDSIARPDRPERSRRDPSFVIDWIDRLAPPCRGRLAATLRRRRDPELLLDLCATAHGLRGEELGMLLPECRAACHRWVRSI